MKTLCVCALCLISIYLAGCQFRSSIEVEVEVYRGPTARVSPSGDPDTVDENVARFETSAQALLAAAKEMDDAVGGSKNALRAYTTQVDNQITSALKALGGGRLIAVATFFRSVFTAAQKTSREKGDTEILKEFWAFRKEGNPPAMLSDSFKRDGEVDVNALNLHMYAIKVFVGPELEKSLQDVQELRSVDGGWGVGNKVAFNSLQEKLDTVEKLELAAVQTALFNALKADLQERLARLKGGLESLAGVPLKNRLETSYQQVVTTADRTYKATQRLREALKSEANDSLAAQKVARETAAVRVALRDFYDAAFSFTSAAEKMARDLPDLKEISDETLADINVGITELAGQGLVGKLAIPEPLKLRESARDLQLLMLPLTEALRGKAGELALTRRSIEGSPIRLWDPNIRTVTHDIEEHRWGGPVTKIRVEGDGKAQYVIVQDGPTSYRAKEVHIDPSELVGLQADFAELGLDLFSDAVRGAAAAYGVPLGKRTKTGSDAQPNVQQFLYTAQFKKLQDEYRSTRKALIEALKGARARLNDTTTPVDVRPVVDAYKLRLTAIKAEAKRLIELLSAQVPSGDDKG